MDQKDSFWLICDDDNDNCHCDWRVTISHCKERTPMFYIYSVNLVWSCLVVIIGSGILFHRVINKSLPLFDYTSTNHRYFLRPKPIESMLFFGLIFNMLRVVNTVILITDYAPNAIVRAFLYELPWQFGICAFSCYLFGIAHTFAKSGKRFKSKWFRDSFRIDILCTVITTLPFITNNICSVSAAFFAERGDFFKAKIFTQTLYFLWTVYCSTLAIWILFSGLKLVNLLTNQLSHLKEDDPNSVTVQKLRNGLFRVRMMMSTCIASLIVFAFIKCTYGIIRESILRNSALSLIVASVWTFDGTLATTCLFIIVIFNPRAITPLSISASSSEGSVFFHKTTKSTFLMHNTPGGNPHRPCILDIDDSSIASTHDDEKEDKKDDSYYQYYYSQQDNIHTINIQNQESFTENMNYANTPQTNASKIHLV